MSSQQQPTTDSATESSTKQSAATAPMTTETPVKPARTLIKTRKPEIDFSYSPRDHSPDHSSETTSITEQALTCDNDECDCESPSVIRDDKHAELTCSECGSILKTTEIELEANWKRTSSKKHARETSVAGNNDSGVTTAPLGGTMDWRDKDGYGNNLSSKRRSHIHRLRELDRELEFGGDERSNYKYSVSEINRLSASMSIPRYVRDSATSMYESLLEADALTGRSIETVSTATLVIACEEDNLISRDFEEFVELAHADASELKDTVTGVRRDLGMTHTDENSTRFVGPMCHEIGLSTRVRERAEQILARVLSSDVSDEGALVEHTGAAVYSACVQAGVMIPQSQIADVAGVSQENIRERYQEHIETAAAGSL